MVLAGKQQHCNFPRQHPSSTLLQNSKSPITDPPPQLVPGGFYPSRDFDIAQNGRFRAFRLPRSAHSTAGHASVPEMWNL